MPPWGGCPLCHRVSFAGAEAVHGVAIDKTWLAQILGRGVKQRILTNRYSPRDTGYTVIAQSRSNQTSAECCLEFAPYSSTAQYSVGFREGDSTNEDKPLPVHE